MNKGKQLTSKKCIKFDIDDHQFLRFGISRWFHAWTYTWINRRKGIRSRKKKGFEIWGFMKVLHLTWRAILRTAVEGRLGVGLIFPKTICYLLHRFLCGSRSFQHIQHLLDNFHASTHLYQMTLLLQFTYQDFYARFGLNTKHSTLSAHPSAHPSSEVAAGEALGDLDMQVDKPLKIDSAIPIWNLDETGAKGPVTNQDLPLDIASTMSAEPISTFPCISLYISQNTQ